jgi:hypothetical protein
MDIYPMQNAKDSYNMPKKFEFPGSTAYYPPILPFTIEYMWLQIKPDFDSNTLKDCIQKLEITALKDINEIAFDIAELDIHQVILSSFNDISILSFDILQKEDKLIIKLGEILYKGNTIDLIIRYSAGYYNEDGILGVRKPRSGFYFVSSTNGFSTKQAWTQGEALESRE